MQFVNLCLFSNRCIVDNTARFHPTDRLKQRFSIQAFRYLTNYTTIYIHCLVLLCQRSSTDSRCISGCYGNNVNRARRDISNAATTTNGEKSHSDYYLLDQGPITLNDGKRGSGRDDDFLSAIFLILDEFVCFTKQ